MVSDYRNFSIGASKVVLFFLLFFLLATGKTAVSAGSRPADIPSSPSQTQEILELYPFSYHESFENGDPFLKWTSNGKYKINYKGTVSEKSSHGKKSFKIDITFETATYVYFMIPVDIPSVGQLNFTGDILVSKVSGARAALGTNNSLFPCPRSGVNILTKEKTADNRWKTQRSDLIEAAMSTAEGQTYKFIAEATPKDVGMWTNRIGLYLFGKPGAAIAIYIDNISIKGKVPENHEYQKQVTKCWKSYQKRIEKRAENLKASLDGHKPMEVDGIFKRAKRKGFFSRQDFKKLNEFIEDKEHLKDNVSDDPLMVFHWNPTSLRNILPLTFPVPSRQTEKLSLTACPGEYEPVSFILRAQKDISDIKIKVTDFRNQTGDLITAESVDIKYVKCWYQAGSNDLHIEKGKKHLTPELLLKDDSLVRVDHEKKKNFLKIGLNGYETYIDISTPGVKLPPEAEIKDSQILQPLELDKNTNKQVWITVKVPDEAKQGNYRANILLSGKDIPSIQLKLTLNVLGFRLPAPVLEYSIYYTGRLVKDNQARIGSQKKNAKQYRLEMEDLKEHGIESATLYQKFGAELEPALKIRNESGLNNGNLYVLGTRTGNPTDKKELKSLAGKVKKWMNYALQFNYENVYIYGIDEANSHVIRSQHKAWKVVKQEGAGILVACPKTAYSAADGLLSIAVLLKRLDSDSAEKWHQAGARVFSYGNPQVGVENPSVYRQNYGFDLWLAGYDGAMNFAYQYDMGNIWDDFDHDRYRDHVFAYPATQSVIHTIQWEGFREAVDDVRYLTALLSTDKYDSGAISSRLQLMRTSDVPPSVIREFIISQILLVQDQK